jgi:hypothetical protein
VSKVSLMAKRLKLEVQKSKYFYAVGIDALEKRWDNCIIVGGGYFEK